MKNCHCPAPIGEAIKEFKETGLEDIAFNDLGKKKNCSSASTRQKPAKEQGPMLSKLIAKMLSGSILRYAVLLLIIQTMIGTVSGAQDGNEINEQSCSFPAVVLRSLLEAGTLTA